MAECRRQFNPRKQSVWVRDADVASKNRKGETCLWRHERALVEFEDPKALNKRKERKGRKEAITFLELTKRMEYRAFEVHDNHESVRLRLATITSNPKRAHSS